MKLTYEEWVKQGRPESVTLQIKLIQHPTEAAYIDEHELFRDSIIKFETLRSTFTMPIALYLMSKLHDRIGPLGAISLDSELYTLYSDALEKELIPTKEFLDTHPEFKKNFEELLSVWRLSK